MLYKKYIVTGHHKKIVMLKLQQRLEAEKRNTSLPATTVTYCAVDVNKIVRSSQGRNFFCAYVRKY